MFTAVDTTEGDMLAGSGDGSAFRTFVLGGGVTFCAEYTDYFCGPADVGGVANLPTSSALIRSRRCLLEGGDLVSFSLIDNPLLVEDFFH